MNNRQLKYVAVYSESGFVVYSPTSTDGRLLTKFELFFSPEIHMFPLVPNVHDSFLLMVTTLLPVPGVRLFGEQCEKR